MPVQGFNRPGDGTGGLKIPDKLNFVANLITKGQPATMADSVATLINRVLNLGNVGSKRFASGTVTSSSGTATFVNHIGSNASSYYVTVSGLTFTPSLIHVYVPSFNGFSTVFQKGLNYGGNSGADILTSQSTFFRNVSPALVSGSSFQLPVVHSSTLFTWVAYE